MESTLFKLFHKGISHHVNHFLNDSILVILFFFRWGGGQSVLSSTVDKCADSILSLGAVVMGSRHDDWKKAEAVAKIIARCPSQVTSLMDYYSVVCPQVCV